MRISSFIGLVLLATISFGCARSSRDVPVLPSNGPGNQDLQQTMGVQDHANRHILGLWRVHVSDDLSSGEAIPLRSVDMHLNTVHMLEVSPCHDCLKAEHFKLEAGDIVQCDIRLKHPIGYNIKLAGFDVRGIFISKPDFTFPACGRKVAMGDGVPRLLNPDGFTSLFNPTEYPSDKPGFPALKYVPGNYSPGGDLSSTLNPYVAYNKDVPRRCFPIHTESTRTIRVHLPYGVHDFGYAVDACWQTVSGGIVDPIKEMPPDANCLEAYQVSVWAGPGLSLDPGAWTWIYATVYDHQGFDTISIVTAEVPGVIAGTAQLNYYQELPDGGRLFKAKVFNELNAPTGDYPCLVRVMDKEVDQNLGVIDAWMLGSFAVRRGWVLTWQGLKNGYTEGSDLDKDGNIYTLLWGPTDADADPTPGFSPIPGPYPSWNSIYINKFDWGGGLEWSRFWTGFDWGNNQVMALDHQGDPLIAGSFDDTLDMDPGPGVDEHTAVGSGDLFLLELDTNGQYLWSLVWPEEGGMGARVVLSGAGSDIYLAGRFNGTVDFDPGPGVDQYTAADDYSASYLIKLGSDTAYKWGCVWDIVPPHSSDSVRVSDIKETASGDIVVAGAFFGIADLDPGPGVEIHDSEAEWAAFLIKLDSDGSFKWARSWTAGYSTNSARAPVIAIDQDGNIYVAHWFGLVTDLDPGPKQDIRISNGGADTFLSKFDSDGNFLWARTWGGKGADQADSLLIDNSNSLWVVGGFAGTVDFDPGSGSDEHTSTGPGGRGAFLSKFDLDGNYQGVQIWERDWTVQDLRCDAYNNIYFGWEYGHQDGGTDFDPGPKTEIRDPEGPYDEMGNYGQRPFLLKTPADGNWW